MNLKMGQFEGRRNCNYERINWVNLSPAPDALGITWAGDKYK